MAQKVTDRPLAGLDDVMAVHAFLSKTYRRTGTGMNWEIRRWEGQFWHDETDLAHTPTSRLERVHLWESQTGRLLGVATPEDGGDVHLQIDPKHRALEPQMLDWAEEHLSVEDDGRHTLTTFCLAGDTYRTHILRSRGYVLQGWGSVQRWRDLTTPLPKTRSKRKYEIRGLGDCDRAEYERLTALINASFGHDFSPDALLNFASSPSYNPDLQIVAERDGTLVSHVGVTLDKLAKLAIVEPVCTHPDWQGKGLAAPAMAEGLRRAAKLGATRAVVGTGIKNPSNHVYSLLAFGYTEVVQAWEKTWV